MGNILNAELLGQPEHWIQAGSWRSHYVPGVNPSVAELGLSTGPWHRGEVFMTIYMNISTSERLY